jgi:tetratricopeptide (TPR) repeat protein
LYKLLHMNQEITRTASIPGWKAARKLSVFILFFSISTFLAGQNDFNYYFNQGQEKYVKGNFSAAADDFSNALKNKKTAKNDYRIANAYMARSMCRMSMQNYNSAIDDISEAIELKPEYSDLYMARSIIHLQAKQYDECITWANKGLQLKPEFEELILIKVKAKLSKKNYAEALNDLDTVLLKINPRNLEAWNLRGDAKQKQKEFKGAADAFTKAIEIDAQNYAAFYDRGICRAHLKDFDGALADMTRGMEIDSTEKWIGYNNIAYFIKFEQKDYKGSLALFDEAIKLNPKFAYAYNNRGYAKLQMNDLKGARQDIMKGLDLNEENSYAYKTLAQLLFAEKKDKLACEKLQKALVLGYTEDYDEEVNEMIKEHCK